MRHNNFTKFKGRILVSDITFKFTVDHRPIINNIVCTTVGATNNNYHKLHYYLIDGLRLIQSLHSIFFIVSDYFNYVFRHKCICHKLKCFSFEPCMDATTAVDLPSAI